jgi:GT2 family glycosyltransferase
MGVAWLRNPDTYRGYVPVAPCSATIISAHLFRKLGGYDLGLPLYGAAEAEFSVRLWLSGAKIKALPDLVLLHHFRSRQEHGAFLKEFGEILVHNYVRFGLLYLSGALLTRMLRFYATRQPQLFRAALLNVVRNGVWHQRERLRKSLRYDILHYLGRFANG